jgi:hypothetical protein
MEELAETEQSEMLLDSKNRMKAVLLEMKW